MTRDLGVWTYENSALVLIEVEKQAAAKENA